MAEPPWIIDTWVNLLRPLPEHQGAARRKRLRPLRSAQRGREGTAPEALVTEMDAAGVALGGLCSTDLNWVTEAVSRYPGRFFGIVTGRTEFVMDRETLERVGAEMDRKYARFRTARTDMPKVTRRHYDTEFALIRIVPDAHVIL